MAISHVFTNPVPDGTITSIVRPSDWNSAHNQYYTLAGNTLGNSTVSGTNVVFQGAGNVSLSGTGQSIIFYATGGGGGGSGGVAIGASTQTATSGTVNFANSNGISFGMAGSSQITASYTVPTQSVQTQASGNIVGSGFSSTTTTGTAIVGTQDSLGLNLGVPAYLTTQSVQTQASGNIAGTGFTSTTTTGTAITGALGTNGLNIAVPAYLTSAAAGAANFVLTGATSGNTTASGSTINLSGINITLSGTNGSQIAISAPPVSALTQGNNITISSTGSTIGISAQAVAVGAGTQTATSGTVVFSNSNGVSFGLNNGTLTASAAAGGNFSGGVSNLGNTAGSTGVTGTRIVFVGTNNISLSQSTDANGATISINQTGGGVGPTAYVASLNGSTGSISLNVGSSLSSSVNGSSITFGLANNITTALQSANANYLTSQSNQAFSASGGSSAFQTLDLQASNGITFSNNAGAVRVSHDLQFTSNTSAITANALNTSASRVINIVAATNNTGGGTSSLSSNVSFSNANGMTFYTSAGGAIVASYTVPTQSVQTQASGNLAGIGFTSTTTAGTAVVGTQNSLGLSLGVPVYLTTQSVQTQASGNLAGIGFTSTTTVGTAIVGTQNSLGLSLGVPAYLTTQSVQTQASGAIAGTGTSATNATFTLNSNGLALSVAAPGAANYSIGVSNLGNTAGSTGITGTRIVFVGTNNISLSQSTDANGATISFNQTGGGGAGNFNLSGATSGNTTATGNTINLSGINITLSGTNNSQIAISAPATSSIVGGAGISISSAGSTISVLNNYMSSYENLVPITAQTMTLNLVSVSHAAGFNVPEPLSASFIRIPLQMTTNSTTIASSAASATGGAAIYSTFNAVVYSLGTGGNSQSLQSVASGSGGFTFSNSISIDTNGTQCSISQGYSAQANGGGTTFTTQTSTSLSNYPFSTNSFTAFTGGRYLDIPFANSLAPGPYWIVFGGSTSSAATTGAAALSVMTNCNVRYSNHYGVPTINLAFGIMGSSNLTSGGAGMGAGSFSTAGGGTTNSIPLSAISSSASNVRLYFQMLRFA